MIKEKVTISWYCTDCREEYKDKTKIGVCNNHPNRGMCEGCWSKCDDSSYHSGKETTGEGCHEIFCMVCLMSSPWDITYPIAYCKDCIERIGIDPFNYRDVWDMLDEFEKDENKALEMCILHGKNLKDPSIVYYPVKEEPAT